MGFRAKLVAAVLASVLSLGGVFLLGLERVIRHYEDALTRHQAETLVAVRARLGETFNELSTATINLSKPREIVNALAIADNEALHDWSQAFVGISEGLRRIDTIGFVDPGGLVIARAPDEFRFGDDVSASRVFRDTTRNGKFVGVAEIDGAPCLVAARMLRKYDDLPVGMVYVATAITPTMLAVLSGNPTVTLTYADATARISSTTTPAASPESLLTLGGLAPGQQFTLAFLPDEAHANLLSLKTWLTRATVIASFATVAGLLGLLRHQLRPYDVIISGIIEYANHGTSLFSLRNRLLGVGGSDGSAAKVAGALIRMIDSLDASFKRIEEHTSKLEVLARADALTALYNRRAMDEALALEIRRLQRYGQRFSVILGDIDHFKAINDGFGHPIGDLVLHRVADVLHANSRATDVVGRWGGEEFLMLCPDAGLEAAHAHAENLRAAIEATAFPDGVRITASFGVAECGPDDTAATLVARADLGLYAAKAAGRNAVRVTTRMTA